MGPPELLYGTAWKEDDTERLVMLALEAGFRGIDTANQLKHYQEAGVGRALRRAFGQETQRAELFLQTKFTYVTGQDQRLPYDPKAPIAVQVAQSCASSLEHLGVAYLDSFFLHGPWRRAGWSPNDIEAWSAMEALRDAGTVRSLGISNVSLDQLQALCARARVQPAWVQNRCYASTGWDEAVRRFCRERGIGYQGFSLLTANGAVLQGRTVQIIARRHSRTPAQVIFRFAQFAGMVPLTGTTDPEHMLEDLAASGFNLSEAEQTELARAG